MARLGQPDVISESPTAPARAQEHELSLVIPDAIASEIARSREYLDAGEIALARDAYLRGRALSMRGSLRQANVSDLAELCSLDGEICEREGRPEAALAAYRIAHSLAPHGAGHLIDAIELVLDENPAGAIAMCREAASLAQDDDDRMHLILLEAEARVERRERDVDADPESLHEETRAAVCALLARLDHFVISDADIWAHVGDLYRAVGEFHVAEHVYHTALTLDPECADVYYGLGYLYEALGDDEQMIESWLMVRELDLENPPDLFGLSEPEWAQIARRTLAELPASLQGRLVNLGIEIASVPEPGLVQDGINPRLYGCTSGLMEFDDSGVPRFISDGVLHLFTHALARAHRDHHELAATIRTTVCREAAYYLGLDEDEIVASRLD